MYFKQKKNIDVFNSDFKNHYLLYQPIDSVTKRGPQLKLLIHQFMFETSRESIFVYGYDSMIDSFMRKRFNRKLGLVRLDELSDSLINRMKRVDTTK